MERQSALEESLLSLGEFEEAYSELWAWLTDALRQLGEAEPITGDPDLVAAQLARHKVYIHVHNYAIATKHIYLYACMWQFEETVDLHMRVPQSTTECVIMPSEPSSCGYYLFCC